MPPVHGIAVILLKHKKSHIYLKSILLVAVSRASEVVPPPPQMTHKVKFHGLLKRSQNISLAFSTFRAFLHVPRTLIYFAGIALELYKLFMLPARARRHSRNGTPSKYLLYTPMNHCTKFGALVRSVTIFFYATRLLIWTCSWGMRGVACMSGMTKVSLACRPLPVCCARRGLV